MDCHRRTGLRAPGPGNSAPLEASARVDIVVLDKTGTLTKCEPEVTDVVPAARLDEEEALRLAAVERGPNTLWPPPSSGTRRPAVCRGKPSGTSQACRGTAPLRGAGRRVTVGIQRLAEREGLELAELSDLAANGRTVVIAGVRGGRWRDHPLPSVRSRARRTVSGG
ncbi:HAD family hydrolase [Streptomyces sp. NPDC127098]|uniref:HAD family hydrolase n=1 Tax=Streptomyces sp. NPDC127098 TaxID=3347137 RepID=UPI0036505526